MKTQEEIEANIDAELAASKARLVARMEEYAERQHRRAIWIIVGICALIVGGWSLAMTFLDRPKGPDAFEAMQAETAGAFELGIQYGYEQFRGRMQFQSASELYSNVAAAHPDAWQRFHEGLKDAEVGK